MAVNAGPYASWGLYKANRLALAFARWWIDGLPIIPPVTGPGLPIAVTSRLTRLEASRVIKVIWTAISQQLRVRR
jgi:hypothetical protein